MTTLDESLAALLARRDTKVARGAAELESKAQIEAAKWAFLHPGAVVVIWEQLVRVVKVGSKDWLKYLPNCIEYENLGWRGLRGRWWEVKPERIGDRQPYRSKPGDYFQTRADRLYFTPWDGRGMFFGTPKSVGVFDLILRWRKQRSMTSKGCRSNALDAIESRIERLLAMKAGPCPTTFQP